MATVYLAHDPKHGRKVAIKVLRPELAAVIGAERFLEEIRTTAALQHPHILPLFDSGVADSFLFYAMPFVDGISLRDRMTREKQLPVGDAVRIATEVASALDYAHRQGVIHRDIKPENILLHDGSALVADFGIALAASRANTRLTDTGMSLGTPQYMSPEQAMGERELDARTDVYALGCVTYEMLTGEPPFSGPTAQAIIAKVMTAEPPEATTLRRTIPPHVADAVHTAIEKLPADRFDSARAFADALRDTDRARRHRRRAAEPPSRRALRPAAIALIAAAALLAGAAGALLLRRDDAPPNTARVRLGLPPGQELLADAFPNLTTAPNDAGILYLGVGAGARSQLWLRRWDRLQAEPLPSPETESCCAVFSPSGDSVAYMMPPRTLRVVSLTDGRVVTLPDLGLVSMTDLGGGLDWGADGYIYAVGTAGLLRIDPGAASTEVVARPDSARGDALFLWPQVLPGGSGAIVTVVGNEGRSDPERASIGIADFSTGRVEIVVAGTRALYAPTGHLLVVKPNGVLWAMPFDAAALRATGAARELADTVAVRFGNAAPGVSDIALADDGTLTYVSGGAGTLRLVWVDRSGRWEPADDGVEHVVTQGMAFSPDGQQVVRAEGGQDRQIHLWLASANGGNRVRLTFDGTLNIRPRWRPNSNTISYLSDHETPGATGLRLYRRDATGRGAATRVHIGDDRAVGGHAWSPDGRWLLFRTDDQEPGAGDILGIRPGIDSAPRVLVATPAEELSPAVSPDGRWLAYTSSEFGRREVYVRPFPETGEARYQISNGGGITPVWSPDGRELFYVDQAARLVAVPVLPGPTFRTGAREVLFPLDDYSLAPFHPQFTVAPDGRRFLMYRVHAGTDLGLVAVFGFLADLEQRMAAER